MFGCYWLAVILVATVSSANGQVRPFIVFADVYTINAMNLDGSDYRVLVNNTYNVIGVDYDLQTNTVYWCQVDSGTIHRSSLYGNGTSQIVISGLGNPDEVAIDWINRKLYWCDFKHDLIEYSNLDGSNRNVLLRSNIDQPRAIALDPCDGYIYWTDWGSSPRIEKMKLSGTGRKAIVSTDLVWPNALTIDYDNRLLYWADANLDKIELSDLDGNGRTVLYHSNLISHPYGITLYGGALYWTDWNHKAVVIWRRSTSRSLYAVKRGLLRPTGIHVVHPLRQPDKVDDSSTSTEENPQILFADVYTINTMNLDGSDYRVLVNNTYNAIGVDYDLQTNTVYWCQVDNGTIHRSSLYGNGTSQIVISGLGNPDEVAIDWINRKLYWCDYEHNVIEYSNLDGSNRNVLLRSNIDQPRAIALDPCDGYIYWTDWGSSPRIEKMKLSGTGRKAIVSTDLVWPNALTIDYDNRLLYWADANLDKIELSDLDGNGRTVLYDSSLISHPYGITLYNGILYWTDWNTYSVISGGAVAGSVAPFNITNWLLRPTGIHILHSSRQRACSPPCEHYTCPTGSECKQLNGEPYCEPSCSLDNGGCLSSEKCSLINVACSKLPCPPKVNCIDPCKSFSCSTGQRCEQFNGMPFCKPSCSLDNGGCLPNEICSLTAITCSVQPCPPKVNCFDPCKNHFCPTGYQCKHLNGTPYCEPSCSIDNGGCSSSETCSLVNVPCSTPPCPPKVNCTVVCPPTCSHEFCSQPGNANKRCSRPPPRTRLPCPDICYSTLCEACYYSEKPHETFRSCKGCPTVDSKCYADWAKCVNRKNKQNNKCQQKESCRTAENFRCYDYPPCLIQY